MGTVLLIYLNMILDVALIVLTHYQQRRTSLQNLTELHRENSDLHKNAHTPSSLKIKKRLFSALKAILVLRLVLLVLVAFHMDMNFYSKAVDVLGSLSWLFVYKLMFNFILRLNVDSRNDWPNERRWYIVLLAFLCVVTLLLCYYVHISDWTLYHGMNAFIGLAFGASSLMLLLYSIKLLSSIRFYTPYTQKLKKKVGLEVFGFHLRLCCFFAREVVGLHHRGLYFRQRLAALHKRAVVGSQV